MSDGWVPAMVRPRRRCAASSGVRRKRSRSASNSAANPWRSGDWCRSAVAFRVCRQLHHLDGGAQLQDVGEPAAEDLHRGDEPGFERQGRVDRGQRGVDGLGVEGGFDDRRDEALLVGEDPEDRALGDPGRFGDLAGRDGRAVHQQQRQRRGDDLGSAFGGRQRRRPFGGDHGPSI